MNYLKKAKDMYKEHQDIAGDIKKMYIDKTQSNNGSSQSAGHASESTMSTPMATPSSTTLPSSASTFSANSAGGVDAKSLKVSPCTFPGAPTKPSLADRKKMRDDFDEKKGAFEKEFSQILGQPWSIHVDTAGVYTYMKNDTYALSNPGVYIHNYFEGASKWLKIFVQKYGAAEAAKINELAPLHVITLEPTSKETVKHHDTDFVDGRWRLLFRDTAFGWNATDCCSNLADVLNASSKGTSSGEISLAARQNIKTEYDGKIGAELQKAREHLNEPNLVFDPNFAENYATLSALEATLNRSDRNSENVLKERWERNFGAATLSYFSGFVSQLGFKKFKQDDMMQEAFKDVVSSNTVKFLVTSELSRPRNDCVIEDGVLVIRTDPANWWVNTNNACDQIDQLL